MRLNSVLPVFKAYYFLTFINVIPMRTIRDYGKSRLRYHKIEHFTEIKTQWAIFDNVLVKNSPFQPESL